jgi:GTP-binding protein
VIFRVDSSLLSLSSFERKRKYAAKNGLPGEGGKRSGAAGADICVSVPRGTVVSDTETEGVIADLVESGQEWVVVRGGRGGRGNAKFATSTRQAPRRSELGQPGEHRSLHLELKLIADVGLVGLPNAGKSTMLAQLTGAHPKIAAYPFTTLIPNLGVAEVGGQPGVLADIPGLIEGAHKGVGLGTDFLRHIERTGVLIHLVDVTVGVEQAELDIKVVEEELAKFSPLLQSKARILALNKTDELDAAEAAKVNKLAKRLVGAELVSAKTGAGCPELLAAALRLIPPAVAPAPEVERVWKFEGNRGSDFSIELEGRVFVVNDERAEEAVAMTDLENDEAVSHLQRRLIRMGVEDALVGAGCKDGDTVRIGESEFVFKKAG